MGYTAFPQTQEFECVVCLELVGMLLATEVHYIIAAPAFIHVLVQGALSQMVPMFSASAKLRLI